MRVKKRRNGKGVGWVRLTQRDIEILKWMNGFGFVTVEHLQGKMLISKQAVYRRMRKLGEDGYVVHERIFVDEPGVFRVAKKGVDVSGDDLGPGKITIGSYKHDLKVVNLALELEEKTGGIYLPERRIRKEKGMKGVGQAGHVPDGILILPDGKQIAVEVELSTKGAARLEKILKGYVRLTEFTAVWYFVESLTIAERVKNLSAKMPFIQVFHLHETEKAINHR
jgi:hypothetical protein